MTLTLTEFLLARIAEDEAAACAVRDERPANAVSDAAWTVASLREPLCSFVLRNGPNRVLAECAAKRAIARAYESANLSSGVDYELGFGLDLAVRALAAVYSDHADYREEWRYSSSQLAPRQSHENRRQSGGS